MGIKRCNSNEKSLPFTCHSRFKTGKSLQNWQNLPHKYKTDLGPFRKLSKKLASACVTPVTQITEPLSTRRTGWYNGWYNNQLKES